MNIYKLFIKLLKYLKLRRKTVLPDNYNHADNAFIEKYKSDEIFREEENKQIQEAILEFQVSSSKFQVPGSELQASTSNEEPNQTANEPINWAEEISKRFEEAQAAEETIIQEANEYGLTEPAEAITTDDTENQKTQIIIEQIKQIIIKDKQESIETRKPKNIARIIKNAEEANLKPLNERIKDLAEIFINIKQKAKTDMVYFVMYDIENNKVRTKVSKYLEEKGLRRIQYSVFLGQTRREVYNLIQTVLSQIQQTYENNDSIIMVPASENILKKMNLIGKEINFSLTLGRTNTVFI